MFLSKVVDNSICMNKAQNNNVNTVNEKIGIGMIVATLAVILFAVAVFLYQQKNEDTNEIQRQGVGMVRLLSSMSLEQLVVDGKPTGVLRLLKEAEMNRHFEYVALVDIDGRLLAEVVASGVIVPTSEMPTQPSQWIGVREHRSDATLIIYEYFSPIIEKGALKAFVRLGYRAPSYSLNASQVRLLAILAMAIFMLTPIFYFMIKKEIKPLNSISTQLQALIKKAESPDSSVSSVEDTQDFMSKFSTIVAAAYNHIDSLEEKQTNAVVSNKLLVYQQARLESALSALPCEMLIADESGQITYASNNIKSLVGVAEEQALGNSLSSFCGNTEMSRYLANCQVTSAGNIQRLTEEAIYLPEVDKRVLVKAYPLYSLKKENQLLGSIIVLSDTSDEEAEKRQNGEFVAHVAHELKSPLNILYMYSETLLDNADASRELTIEAANVIHDETGRISQMIDNLLNLAMIEMGTVPLHRQRVKMGEFLRDVYQTMSRDKHIGAIEFTLNIPDELGALLLDKDLVRISLNNLISNAIKYNKPDGKIELIAEENDKEIIIRVRDTGIGISEQDRHRIFSKFFRSEHEEVRKRTGHGLGLSLVHETIKLHHGDIQLHSTLGEGSEFVLSFTKDSTMLKDAIRA